MNAAHTLKLLLVDDEQEFALTLAERLQLRGFSATVCFDGENALQRVCGEDFDLVLLDVMLPGQSGLTVLRRIRELRPELPAVLLTGHARAGDGIEGMKQGARAYLSKPVDLQELLDILAEIAQETHRE